MQRPNNQGSLGNTGSGEGSRRGSVLRGDESPSLQAVGAITAQASPPAAAAVAAANWPASLPMNTMRDGSINFLTQPAGLTQRTSLFLQNPNPAILSTVSTQDSLRQQEVAVLNRLRQLREAEAAAAELELQAVRRALQENHARRMGISQVVPHLQPGLFPRPQRPNLATFGLPASQMAYLATNQAPHARPPIVATNTVPLAASLPRGAFSPPDDTMTRLEVPNLRKRQRQRSDSQEDRKPAARDRKKVQREEETKTQDGDRKEGTRSQAQQWEDLFQHLKEYRLRFGTCMVPQHTTDNIRLARWVKRQRYQYKLMKEGKVSNMTPQRIQRLESIGFVWDSHNTVWQERFEEMMQFKREHSHCNVPITYEANKKLAAWVKCQRRQYKLLVDGEPSNMTSERVAILEGVGFEWRVRQDIHTIRR